MQYIKQLTWAPQYQCPSRVSFNITVCCIVMKFRGKILTSARSVNSRSTLHESSRWVWLIFPLNHFKWVYVTPFAFNVLYQSTRKSHIMSAWYIINLRYKIYYQHQHYHNVEVMASILKKYFKPQDYYFVVKKTNGISFNCWWSKRCSQSDFWGHRLFVIYNTSSKTLQGNNLINDVWHSLIV